MSGGGAVTSGGDQRRRLMFAAAFVAIVVVQTVVNIESRLADHAALGRPELPFNIWIDEGSSAILWLGIAPIIWRLVRDWRPPRLSWPATFASHAVGSIFVSLVHVAGMFALRDLLNLARHLGRDVDRDWGAFLLYEYRKDAATYAILALTFALAQRFLLPPPTPAAPERLQVSDGSRTYLLPHDEIRAAVAAGNYVDLDWNGRSILHRTTLAALGEMLGPDFVRVHRGTLVRRADIRAIATDRSGDFTVTLDGGRTMRGSRRYRRLVGNADFD